MSRHDSAVTSPAVKSTHENTPVLKQRQRLSWIWFSIDRAGLVLVMLRSEIPSGKCAKLHTVAASNNRVHPTRPSCSRHVYIGVVFARIPFVVWWTAHSAQRQRRGCNSGVQVKFSCQG